jgi:hypothetical protein
MISCLQDERYMQKKKSKQIGIHKKFFSHVGGQKRKKTNQRMTENICKFSI